MGVFFKERTLKISLTTIKGKFHWNAFEFGIRFTLYSNSLKLGNLEMGYLSSDFTLNSVSHGH